MHLSRSEERVDQLARLFGAHKRCELRTSENLGEFVNQRRAGDEPVAAGQPSADRRCARSGRLDHGRHENVRVNDDP